MPLRVHALAFFTPNRLTELIQWRIDNGSPYVAADTRRRDCEKRPQAQGDLVRDCLL